MTIETVSIPSQLLAEYAAIPMAFEVTSVLSAQQDTERSFVLTERRLDRPYVKDYDAIGDRPRDWASRFDTSQWVLFLARGCAELKVETQNVNVPACRFYAALGCELRVVLEDAYSDCPGEAQFLWYKALQTLRTTG
jgi:hypothetical protein